MNGEPLTYYVGTLSIPGEERPFTVVVTQLIDMGNPDAAIATTKVIPRWRPRNVLMVGIAGGVKGKVALGDVVVSQYAHDYEPAKLTPDGVEHRDRQFNSDLMLYARAQHYEAADWKGEIHAAPGPDRRRTQTARGEIRPRRLWRGCRRRPRSAGHNPTPVPENGCGGDGRRGRGKGRAERRQPAALPRDPRH